MRKEDNREKLVSRLFLSGLGERPIPGTMDQLVEDLEAVRGAAVALETEPLFHPVVKRSEAHGE